MTDDCNNHERETVRRINPSNPSFNRVMPSSITQSIDLKFIQNIGQSQCLFLDFSVQLSKWLLVYSAKDRSRAQGYVMTMQQVCPQMGIELSPPIVEEVRDGRIENYLHNIRKYVPHGIQIVVVILPSLRDDHYNAIKKVCCCQLSVPSQIIISRTLADLRKRRSVTQKVALQMNCKLGGELWAIKMPTTGLMVCGFDTYHHKDHKNRSVGGFVSSTNDICTRWYSRVCHQMPGEELIHGMQVCFISAIRKYHEVNHCLPRRIVIYRDGTGDGDIIMVRQYEVEALNAAFASFDSTYKPCFTVIVCQKRIHTRIFGRRGPEYTNPKSGTVVDHTITRNNFYDFFLVSQHVRYGTVKPTHYIIVHDSSGWDTDKLQRLTYKLTHLYYNWTGTVRVPAPVQYAHKLVYQVGENLREDPSLELSNRLFYL